MKLEPQAPSVRTEDPKDAEECKRIQELRNISWRKGNDRKKKELKELEELFLIPVVPNVTQELEEKSKMFGHSTMFILW